MKNKYQISVSKTVIDLYLFKLKLLLFLLYTLKREACLHWVIRKPINGFPLAGGKNRARSQFLMPGKRMLKLGLCSALCFATWNIIYSYSSKILIFLVIKSAFMGCT